MMIFAERFVMRHKNFDSGKIVRESARRHLRFLKGAFLLNKNVRGLAMPGFLVSRLLS